MVGSGAGSGAIPVEVRADSDSGGLSDSLRSPFWHVRRSAEGTEARPNVASLLSLLSDPDFRVRRAAVRMIVERLSQTDQRDPAVLDQLALALVRAPDRDTRAAMAESLAPIGGDVLQSLAAVRSLDDDASSIAASRSREAEAGEEGRNPGAVAYRALLEATVHSMLRSLLEEITSLQGSVKGFFKDPFTEVRSLGDDVYPVLLRMAADPSWSDSIRGLAVRALAEFRNGSAIEPLRAICRNQKQIVEAREALDPKGLGEDTQLYRACRYVLYRLGEEEPFYLRILELTRRMERAAMFRRTVDYFDFYWQIAYEYHQIKEFEIAIRRYLRLIERLDGALPSLIRISYYNLACIHSLQGKLDKAFEYMDQAIEQGFRDLDWILIDRDLEPLRADPRFERIRTELSK